MMPVATPLYSFYWVTAHFEADVTFRYLGSPAALWVFIKGLQSS
eukprot:COSAG01_NODE_1285_length_10901_cov_5.922514_2_plen_44_part_00